MLADADGGDVPRRRAFSGLLQDVLPNLSLSTESQHMQLDSELLDNKAIKVSLDGRLDIQGANAIDMQFTALTATKKAAVLVDMSKVSFMASIGIRLLLSNAKACSARGGKMVLFAPQPLVKDVLQSAGVTKLIETVDDQAAAEQAAAGVESA